MREERLKRLERELATATKLFSIVFIFGLMVCLFNFDLGGFIAISLGLRAWLILCGFYIARFLLKSVEDSIDRS